MPHETDAHRLEAIEASWRRSVATGLMKDDIPAAALTSTQLEAARARSGRLLKYAEPSMENTYEQLAGTGSVVLIADADGVVLSRKGDPDFVESTHGDRLRPGACWGEAACGTNAIGTTIARQAAMTIETQEHHLRKFHSLSGAAAPIFDSAGQVLGVLAAYSARPESQYPTLGFIRTVATLIENRILVREMAADVVIRFHLVADYLETIKQGIMVFDADGKLVGTNTAARDMLRLSLTNALNKRFSDLIGDGFSLESLVNLARTVGSGHLTTLLADGRQVTVSASVGSSCNPNALVPQITARTVPSKRAMPSAATTVLQDLDLGDPQVQRAITKASMIQGSDIPLLIEGESGVGKEVFTAAFHNSGPRKRAPFVAVNCAAIPEGLIESELFGYEGGAFTGANRKGYEGRILMANGGTLLLDEIGDMPLALQGRLLRVLQERQVTPLGSAKSVSVDIALVCATHRNLRAEVAAGRFREDLYYRLNGLRIHLPALRERTDIDRLIRLIIDTERGERPIEVADDVKSALRTYAWPGNIRELQMVLRTAIAIVGQGSRLTLQHLPDEFSALLPADAQEVAHGKEWADLAHIEADAIRKAMMAAQGNVSKASRVLGISRKTLYRKLSHMASEPVRADASDAAVRHS